MVFQFRKHYNRDEARALLPKIRDWLKQLGRLRQSLSQQEQRLARLLAAGNDAGGELVNHWVKTVAATKKVLQEFAQREIQVKGLDRDGGVRANNSRHDKFHTRPPGRP